MKNYYKFLMLSTVLCSFGASAQSVTVVKKNGTMHKFGTDYIQSMTFQEVEIPNSNLEFTEASIDAYSGGNFLLSLKADNGDLFELDAYGPKTAVYLHEGTYQIGTSTSPFNIDNGSYSVATVGGTKLSFKEGALTVSMTEREYTLALKATLSDDSTVEGSWTGQLPWYSKYAVLTMSQAEYNSNPNAPGEFYVKFNDTAYKCEMALDIFGQTADTTLQPGTYTYSADAKEAGFFNSKSYITLYKPYATSAISEGTVTVEREGDSYSINMYMTLEDGRIIDFEYDGAITGTPTFDNPVVETPVVELSRVAVEVYSSGKNNTLTFFDAEGNELALDTYAPEACAFLPTGEYKIGTGTGFIKIDNAPSYTYYKSNGTKTALKEGTMLVSNDGKTYTFEMAFILEDGKEYKAKYVGEIPNFSQYVTKEMSAAKYNENPQTPGTFYVTLNDASWGVEMALELVGNAADTTLQPGTYNFSAEAAPMSVTATSYITTYKPTLSGNVSAGSVTVTKDGDNYTISMNLTLTDSRVCDFTYTGAITGTPTFDNPVVTLSRVAVEVYSSGKNNTLTFFDAEGNELALDTYAPEACAFLPTGEYKIGTGTGFIKIDNAPSYTYYKSNGTKTALKEGTMLVSNDGKTYTFEMAFILEDGKEYKAKYVGEIPNFSQYVTKEMSAAKYNENPQTPGTFYVTLNDASWGVEMALELVGNAADTTLQPGTYNFSAEAAPMSVTATSYITTYKPTLSGNVSAGAVTVTKDGDNYTISMNLTLTDARVCEFTYTGAISGTPTFN